MVMLSVDGETDVRLSDTRLKSHGGSEGCGTSRALYRNETVCSLSFSPVIGVLFKFALFVDSVCFFFRLVHLGDSRLVRVLLETQDLSDDSLL